ncbi:hypothetical protein GH714_020982 [Hevea brasiliensis]|uniref:HTH La-type RNA-binding domain-containing protein n=1 Tax=Hevea brasiliensis TaxID=3981 RepID=A0A6A6LMC4_HEVBR|nr:hypothetical protein GH714_020982 [Hevea brasiliensis]
MDNDFTMGHGWGLAPIAVEFYFSDSNLPRDDFLMKKVSQGKDGSILLFNLYMLDLVNSVRLPRHVADKRVFCGTALIEFSTDADVKDIFKQTLVYAGAILELKPKKEFDSERAKLTEQIGKDCSNHKNNASTTSKFNGCIFTEEEINWKPVKNGGNVEQVTDSGGVCKEDKNLDSNVRVVKGIENVSDDISESPLKETCKTVEKSCQIVSQEIVNSENSILKTKNNSKEIISEESKAEDLQDAIFGDRPIF